MNQPTYRGPTQTAVEGSAAEWTARPAIASATRFAMRAFPYIVAFAVAITCSNWLPSEKIDLHPVLWWLGIALISTLAMIPADRLVRRFTPMVGLLGVALAFPDAAPTRFRAAMRSTTTAQVRRRIAVAVKTSDGGDAIDRSQYMLDLLTMLTAHDRLTRGHSERVRAYARLIGEEFRLPAGDQQKLHWAALLHDVGKLDVPAELLNKPSKPTRTEWKVIQRHPITAEKYLAPLEGWLGHWTGAAYDHHLRWDGKGGYPRSIGGSDISHAGRIVAVADAYDTMTSVRTYKKGMSGADARVELSKCSGGQFDPTVVRAFLNIGLTRVRLVTGPFASLPVFVANLVSGVATGAKVAIASTAVLGGVAASPPIEAPLVPTLLAFVDDAQGWIDPEASVATRDEAPGAQIAGSDQSAEPEQFEAEIAEPQADQQLSVAQLPAAPGAGSNETVEQSVPAPGPVTVQTNDAPTEVAPVATATPALITPQNPAPTPQPPTAQPTPPPPTAQPTPPPPTVAPEPTVAPGSDGNNGNSNGQGGGNNGNGNGQGGGNNGNGNGNGGANGNWNGNGNGGGAAADAAEVMAAEEAADVAADAAEDEADD